MDDEEPPRCTTTRRRREHVARVGFYVLHSPEDIVDVQVLLADPADFAAMNEAYAAFFNTGPPARSVAKLGVDLPGVRVSIRMIAYTN